MCPLSIGLIASKLSSLSTLLSSLSSPPPKINKVSFFKQMRFVSPYSNEIWNGDHFLQLAFQSFKLPLITFRFSLPDSFARAHPVCDCKLQHDLMVAWLVSKPSFGLDLLSVFHFVLLGARRSSLLDLLLIESARFIHLIDLLLFLFLSSSLLLCQPVLCNDCARSSIFFVFFSADVFRPLFYSKIRLSACSEFSHHFNWPTLCDHITRSFNSFKKNNSDLDQVVHLRSIVCLVSKRVCNAFISLIM